jgi:hypothetical protein
MNSEFKEIVKDTLIEFSYDNDSQKIDLTRELNQDLLSEAIEQRIQAKFHIFRINKILTGDS